MPDRRGVFLDRDRTLIEDVGYPRDPASVRLLCLVFLGAGRRSDLDASVRVARDWHEVEDVILEALDAA